MYVCEYSFVEYTHEHNLEGYEPNVLTVTVNQN